MRQTTGYVKHTVTIGYHRNKTILPKGLIYDRLVHAYSVHFMYR